MTRETVSLDMPRDAMRQILADNPEYVESLIEDARADGRHDIADGAEQLLAEVQAEYGD